MKRRSNILPLVILVILPFLGHAGSPGSNGLTVKGVITQKGHPLEDAHIKVYNGDNRLVMQEASSSDGHFRIELPLDGYYVMEFSKKGRVTKRLLFRTETPDHDETYHPFDLEIVLYDADKVEGSHNFDPDMPLGIVEYFPGKGDFDYVESYTIERLKEQQELLSER